MRKLFGLYISLFAIVVCFLSGCTQVKKSPSIKNAKKIEATDNTNTTPYFSIVCRKKNRTAFILFDFNSNKLKKVFDEEIVCEFPIGIIDKKNNKIYYSLWGDFEKKGIKAGDCLMCYNIKNKKKQQITSIHHVFNSLTIYNEYLYGIIAGKESNGNLQLCKINPNNGEIKPVDPDNTDVRYKNFSIDYQTGEIIASSYSDYASRRFDTDPEKDKSIPWPFFLHSISSDFQTSKLIYTFSDSPYTSIFNTYEEDPDVLIKKWDLTANNLIISDINRLNDHQILFLGAKDVYGDLSLKLLDTSNKTVSDFMIDGKKIEDCPFVSKDKKDMFVLLEPKNKDGGMYRYHLEDNSLDFLFNGEELRTVLDWGTEFEVVSINLVYQ